MIEVAGLSKHYGSLKAVDAISFHIRKGETVGLLGPNGAGKTTTLRLLTGYMPPTAGSVTIAGHDLFEEPLLAKRQIGYLPEHPPLYPELTVEEYLDFVVRLHRIPRSEQRPHIKTVLERLRLGPVCRRPIGQLSRGYQQRVGLAQVLVIQPPILILDEPTVALDPKQIIEIRQLIQELKGDYTVVLSSHILQEVSATCERVIIIHQGKIVAQDTQEALLQKGVGGGSIRVQLKGPPLAEAQEQLRSLKEIETVTAEANNGLITLQLQSRPGEDCRESLFELLRDKNWIPYEISPSKTTLEEIFLKLTQEN